MQLLIDWLSTLPVVVGGVSLVILLAIGYGAHPKGERGTAFFRSILLVFCATGLGVLAGSFASPSESTEGSMFKVVSGILATFATGFLAKQFADQIQGLPAWLAEGKGLNAARFWMAIAAFVMMAIFSYVFRAYFMNVGAEAKLVTEIASDITTVQAKIDRLTHAISAASAARAAGGERAVNGASAAAAGSAGSAASHSSSVPRTP